MKISAMTSIYQLKPKFQGRLRPIVIKLARWQITANQVTLAALVGSIGVALLLYFFSQTYQLFFILPLWLFLRMALNAIDGMLAKEFNQKTALGAYLNELSDVAADTALFAIFFAVTTANHTLLFFIIIFSILSEYAGVMAPLIRGKRRYDGPMGKSDRAFFIGFIGFLLGFGLSGELWINLLFSVMLLMLIITIYNRIKNGILEIK